MIVNEIRRQFPLQWEMTRGYRLPTRVLGEAYFIRWTGEPKPFGEGWKTATFDDDGLLRTGSFRNPVSISQFALSQYDEALEGNILARNTFIKHAQWLAQTQDSNGGYAYPLALPQYDAAPGWLSGMAQGEAASVLLRAYALTNDHIYLEAGKRALAPLLRDTKNGGASYIRNGNVFFEEAATPEPCHILNGHLYAAFGVWEYLEHGLLAEPFASLHQRAIGTLLLWLERFDVNGWSAYDLARDESGKRHAAPLWYHHFHIAQLRIYADMTGEHAFERQAERWYRALHDNRVRARVWKYGAHLAARGLLRRLGNRPKAAFRT